MRNRQVRVGQKFARPLDPLLLHIANWRDSHCLREHVAEVGLAEAGSLGEDGVCNRFVQVLGNPVHYRIQATQLKPVRGNALTGIAGQHAQDLIDDD